jgi:hypothetical protein
MTAKMSFLNSLKNIHGEPQNQMYAFDLLVGLNNEIKLYEEGYINPLILIIQNSDKAYLTEEIKNNIVSILSFEI